MTKRSEVLIVGAGPAGIVAAIAASRRGLQTTVLDARKPPIDKPCGECILPLGVAALEALGISFPKEIAFPFRGFRFLDDKHSATANFARGTGYTVRRVKLHQLLVDEAIEAGVEFHWGTRVVQIDPETVTTSTEKFPYRWLVGADGQNSQVRKAAGLDTRAPTKRRFGFCSHFQVKPWTDSVEVYWGRSCQMFVTPIAGEEVGVAVLSSDPALRVAGALARFPSVAERLRGAATTSREMGDTTTLKKLPAVARASVALIGDASGTVDAVTGVGLSLSFQQAIHLAAAMKHGDMVDYQIAHNKMAAVPVTMARIMLLMDRNDWIRRKSIRLFQKSPGLFAKMLAIHTEAEPLSSVGVAELAGFGWKFLRT